jgi:peptidoglycan/LPS O-acetylase OafA/YrhL
MRLAGSIVMIVAAVGWVALGLFLMVAGAGLGALHDPQSQPEAVLLGTARLGLAAILGVSAVLAFTRPGGLPGALALGAVACGVLAGVAANRLVPPFDWGLVGLAGIGGLLLLLSAPGAPAGGKPAEPIYDPSCQEHAPRNPEE